MISACSSHTVTVSELRSYIQHAKHGLIHDVENQNYKVTLMYQPVDLMLAQRYANDSVIAKKDTIREEMLLCTYFVLHVSPSQKASGQHLAEYAQAAQYMNSQQLSDFKLWVPFRPDPLPIVGWTYVPTYGMTDGVSALISVKSSDIKNSESFSIQINGEALGFATPQFKFLTEDITKVPQVDSYIL